MESSNSNLYEGLLGQSSKGTDIFEIYRDILKLKMAIKLILTKD